MSATSEKARAFQALHEAREGFVIPNPWDIGTSRILAHHGFKALATTSAGFANTLGLADGKLTRDQALAHCRDIANATDLPVSADLEKCFADKPDGVADTVLAASETGIVGCSVEDSTGDPSQPIFPFDLAVERVRFALLAARKVGHPFLITARAESLLHGGTDLDDVIRRLQAFEKLGAPVVYAPGLKTIDQVRQVTSSVRVPVNVLAADGLSTADLFAAGVKRVSLGSWFARAAQQGLLDAIAEVQSKGTFTFTATAPKGAAIAKMLS